MLRIVSLGLVCVLLAGCMSGGQGTAGMTVSDAPVDDWSKIEVTFSRGAIHKSEGADANSTSGWIEIVNTTRTVDLLALHHNDTSAALGFSKVDAGSFQQVRLYVDRVEGTNKTGGKTVMKVPSSVIRVKTHFTVESGGNTTIGLEIDLNKSVSCNNQGCQFSPSLRGTPTVTKT
jgi:hypothetical protein